MGCFFKMEGRGLSGWMCPMGGRFEKKLQDGGHPSHYYGKSYPPLFIKGKWSFSYMAIMWEGRGGFLLEMGAKPVMGGSEIFKVSWHSWQRGANPLILWRPHYIAYPPVFKCCPPRNFSVTSNLHLQYSFCCHISLAEWVITRHFMCYCT